jgi:hypothetical protein
MGLDCVGPAPHRIGFHNQFGAGPSRLSRSLDAPRSARRSDLALSLETIEIAAASLESSVSEGPDSTAELARGKFSIHPLHQRFRGAKLLSGPLHPAFVAATVLPVVNTAVARNCWRAARRILQRPTGLPWPGCESPVMPAHWSQSEVPQGFEAHLERRRLLSSSGARAVGALSAIAFNALGLRLVLAMTSGSIVSLACGFTLWSFVGLLLLPSLSRPGVLAADISVVRQLGPKQARHWLSWLEGFQDEDAVRPNWTERIFHPIPQWSLRSRFARIGNAWWPWNIARYALLTSMLAGGLLSRAVHCNCGRPELWFWPPND